MFYAVAAAVIGGTAMLGGSGTILGAFLGAIVLAVLIDGFNVIGISANPLQHHLRLRDPGRHDRERPACARLRERGRARMTAATPDGQGDRRRRTGEDVLRVEHISKRFGAVTALLDINLHAEAAARCSACSATTARASPRC